MISRVIGFPRIIFNIHIMCMLACLCQVGIKIPAQAAPDVLAAAAYELEPGIIYYDVIWGESQHKPQPQKVQPRPNPNPPQTTSSPKDIDDQAIYEQEDSQLVITIPEEIYQKEEITDNSTYENPYAPDGSIYTPKGVHVHILEIEQVQSHYIRLIKGQDKSKPKVNSIKGKQTITSMIKEQSRQGAIAAINGGYFGKGGLSIGGFINDGHMVSTPIRHRSSLYKLKRDKLPRIGRVKITGILRSTNQDQYSLLDYITINTLNQPVSLHDDFGWSSDGKYHLLAYDEYWESSITCGIGHACLSIVPHRYHPERYDIGRYVSVDDGATAMIPPPGGYLLMGDNNILKSMIGRYRRAQERLKPLMLSWQAQIDLGEQLWEIDINQIDYLLTAGPLLIEHGQKVLNEAAEGFTASSGIGGKSPRSIIGINKENKIMLITVDGRQEGSDGMTLSQLTDMLMGMDVQYALNLDGGGSSGLAYKKDLLNHPPGGYLRPVANAILVFRKRHQ